MEAETSIYYKLGSIESSIGTMTKKFDDFIDGSNARLKIVEDKIDKHDQRWWKLSGILAGLIFAIEFIAKALPHLWLK